MQIEKKLILCSILAITIGIAAVFPLAFLMTPAHAQTITVTPLVNMEIAMSNWTAIYDEYSDGTISYTQQHRITLLYSWTPEALNDPNNPKIEYYGINIYSDQGEIGNMTYLFADNRTGVIDLELFNFQVNNGFESRTSSGGRILSDVNLRHLDTNQSIAMILGGPIGKQVTPRPDWESSSLYQSLSNAINTDKIYMDVHKLGWLTFNGNSTIVTLSDDTVLQHIELTRNGDSFFYTSGQLETAVPPQ